MTPGRQIRFTVLTLFPELIDQYFRTGIVRRGVEQGLVTGTAVNIRDFTLDKHRSVDDVPYGGGSGMVMMIEPVVRALESLPAEPPTTVRRINLAPRGRQFTQQVAEELAGWEHLVLVCGRYEGIDARITSFVDEELSLGEFILNGGETAAMAVIDSVVRLVPGVLGNPNSLNEESFEEGYVEYPHFTRPREFRGLAVPEVLLNGDHRAINEWRRNGRRRMTTTPGPGDAPGHGE